MKISVERNDLFKAMGRAQSVVERRNTIPILSNVLIEAKENSISLRATDLDIELNDKVNAVVEKKGAITVGAHTFYEILRKLPDGSRVTIDLDPLNEKINIEAGRSRFSLTTISVEDFPIMASSDYDFTFSIEALSLKRLFDKVKFAMSMEETRFYLNGVYLHEFVEDEKKYLRTVATDGHRLAKIDTNLPSEANGIPGVIVPRKTVSELRMIYETSDGVVNVSLSDTKIRFSTPSLSLTSKVIDGTFPDYDRVIPKNNTKKLVIDAVEFSKSVDRVATVSSERARAVKLSLSSDKLILSVNAPETGIATEEIPISYSGSEIEIGFNAKYLQEIASQVEKGEAVFLFNELGDPALMKDSSDETAVFVVMPMRV
jgi:DNA polymerase-3 subunit beta